MMFVESKVLSGGKVYFYKDIFTGSFSPNTAVHEPFIEVQCIYVQSW